MLDQRLLKTVDVGLAGCIFVVPLLMGGRAALGQLALITIAVIIAVAWAARQALRRESTWRCSGVEWLLAAGVVLLVLQIVPLPQQILAQAAPKTAELLPLWNTQADPSVVLGTWSCISLTPGGTLAALPLFIAYGLLMLVTIQRIQTIEDAERLLTWIALAVVMMAGFGLVQLLGGNGKFFWFYEHPFADTVGEAKGSFANRNHFAHFLALGVGPLIWWMQRKAEGGRRKGEGGRAKGEGRRAKREERREKREERFRGIRATADTAVAQSQPSSPFPLPSSPFSLLSSLFSPLSSRRAWTTKSRPQTTGYRSVALGVVLFAGLLSLSRGGVAVMLLAVAVSVAVFYRARTVGSRFVLSLAVAAVLIVGLLAIHGYDKVSNRLDDFSAGSIEVLDNQAGRRTIWQAVAKAIPDFALLGAGVGSHVEVYPMYLEHSPGTEYTHAENGPLQVALETGVVGLMLVVVGIGYCGHWCVGGLRAAGSPRMLACTGAIAAAMAVSVVHSFVDFVWYVPGCMAVVAILAGCACRMYQLSWGLSRFSRSENGTVPLQTVVVPKVLAVTAAVVLSAVGTWMIASRIGPTMAEPSWDRYRIIELAASHEPAADRRESTDVTHQADDTSLVSVGRMIAALEQVVARDPNHARAHLRLAAAYLRRFDLTQRYAENAIPLSQIRDATLRARAAARNETERLEVEHWLAGTIGNGRAQLVAALQHTRKGLTLCPLQGEGYLYIAELGFLEGPWSETSKSAYLNQALCVRPFDGAVLFEAGRQAWLAGKATMWLDYWQRSFRSAPKHQRRLIEALAGRVPVAFIAQNFSIDLRAARILHQCCQDLANSSPAGKAQAAEARCYRARLARAEAKTKNLDGDQAVDVYLEAVWLYRGLDDWENALACARGALGSNPNRYEARYAVAQCLARHERYAEAASHLNWCLARRPDDEKLRALARDVIKKRIECESRARCANNTNIGTFSRRACSAR